MTTTMSAVWDRTVMVLQGRGRMLAEIAALTLFATAVVRAGAQALADPGSAGAMALVGLIGIATVIVSLWGQLAIIAAASDPAVLAGEAMRMAARRLPAAIGLAAIVVAIVALLFAPVVVVLVRAGLDMQAMAAGAAAAVPPAVAGFVALYTLAFLVAALFVGARLAVLYPVVLLERNGLGTFARAFRLTRGLTWRILGVLLLYVVVLLVASGAARLVLGTLAALAFGAGATATFVAAVAAALVGAALGTVAVVFTAQLYIALRDARAAMSLDLAAVAREAAARWRQDRAILAPLSGLLLFVPQWATLMLVPDQPAMPANPDQAALQLWAEAVQAWIASYGALYLGALLVAQFGQLAIVALYVDAGARSTAGGALLRAARALPRFLLAGAVVAAPSLAIGLAALTAPALLVLTIPALVYVLGRTVLIGPALLGRRGVGAARAVAASWRWTRGAGLPLALLVGGLLVGMSAAIQAAELAVLGLRQAGAASPALTAALDAGAAAVAWAAMLALAMMQGVLYRRLAR